MKAATNTRHCFSGSGIAVNGARADSQPSHVVARRVTAASSIVITATTQRAHAPVVPRPRMAMNDASSDQGMGAGGGRAVPRVLHVDSDSGTALVLASLLMPEARVTHVTTLAEARRLLRSELFSLVVLDPSLSDGDGSALLPALTRTPLLVYSARQPEWRVAVPHFLPKPWTSPRQLWSTISTLLGIAPGMCAGD